MVTWWRRRWNKTKVGWFGVCVFLTSFPEILFFFSFLPMSFNPVCVLCECVSSPLWCVWNSALVKKKKTKLQDKWSAGFCNLSNSKFWILAPYWRPFAAPHLGGKLWFGCRIFAKLSKRLANSWGPSHSSNFGWCLCVCVCASARCKKAAVYFATSCSQKI